ncbi:putative leucine-rich repeat-containing protein DDB_G0290503 isoform X9 [Parasteatoda tepidariorum]|uniref:putative leucine-rich repeat-containing protein DDB_G0290503 isoform X9 n=1 Tax=Parasteatoda tepidariorum TaxID=114398 RepID=UPI001C72622E|nr:interaptin isoform X5 [Parasteatoda tepidariorum]
MDTYPVHLTDIMEGGQSSQSNFQRTEFTTSPVKETQTKAVREYEETINQLRKENFDLKMRLYLCEEKHRQTYHVKRSYDEKQDCIQIIVNLEIEAEDLRKELNGKEEELRTALEKYSEEIEKCQTELQEAQKKINEQQEFIRILEQLPTIDDYNEVQRQFSEMVSEGDCMKQLLAEKEEEIEKANQESKELQEKIVALNKKIKLRDEAIKSCARKYHEETDYIPKHMRPIIKSTIQAAVDNNEKELVSSLEKLKRSLSEIMGVLIPSNLQSTYVGDSPTKVSSSAHLSGSSENSLRKNSSASDAGVSREVPPGEFSAIEGDLEQSEMISNEPVSHSEKTIQCDLGSQVIESSDLGLDISDKSDSNVETINRLKNENYSLMHKIEEKIKIIESFTTTLSDIEEREQELKDKLGEAYTKINCLEEELEEKQNLLDLELDVPFVSSADKASQYDLGTQTESLIQEINSEIIQNLTANCSDLEKQERELKDQLSKSLSKIKSLELELQETKSQISKDVEKGDSFSQTDITWHSLQSSISDKNLQEFGTSDNINELKEEILMLILAIEQKDKELSDNNQRFMSHESLLMPVDEGYTTERDELHRRLAISCSVNNELLKHLQSLERFMEDLLQQKNASTSSLENINENADFLARFSDYVDRSMKLSQTLSNQLSICEGSRIFDLNDTTMQRSDFDVSDRKSIGGLLDSQFNQEESDIPYIYQEETSKSSFICKKCQRQSQQLDDTLQEENSNVNAQELQQLYEENSSHQNEIENLSEMLKQKEELVGSLNKEKNVLVNEINDLKEELAELQRNNHLLISKQNNSFLKLEEKDSLNEELKGIIRSLEMNVESSKATFEELQTELNQTKERLIELDKKCAKYEKTISSDKIEYQNRITALEQKEKELLENIKEMTLQKDSLLDKLKSEEKRAADAAKEGLEIAEKVKATSEEILQLQNCNKELRELNTSLLNDKTSVETILESSKSEKETLKSEIKSLKEAIEKLRSKCDSFEAEIDFVTHSKQNIIDLLLNFEKSFMLNLKTLSNACSVKFDTNVINFEDVEEMPYLVDEDEHVNELLKRITLENLKFKELASDFTAKIENIKKVKQNAEAEKHKSSILEHQIVLKDEEIKTLNDEIDKLQTLNNEIYELQSSVETFRADHELLPKLKEDVEEKENLLRILKEKNCDLNENVKILQNEKNSSEQALKSANDEISSLQKRLLSEKSSEYYQNLVDLKQNEIGKLQEQIDAKETAKSRSDDELLEKQKRVIEEKENLVRDLKEQNYELKENIKILQNEKNSLKQALKSTNMELEMKENEILQLQEQIESHEIVKSNSDQKLLNTQKKILEEKENCIKTLEEKVLEFEKYVQIFQQKQNNSEKTLISANAKISALQESLTTSQKSNEDCKNSLDLKQKQIDKLQERILTLQSQINELLTEKMNQGEKSQSRRKLTPERPVSPDSSTIMEVSSDSLLHCVSTSLVNSDNSGSLVKSVQSDQMISSNTVKKDREKYLKHIKSLQHKLEEASSRNEVLEKEKNSLRDNLLSCVHNFKRNSTEKAKEEESKIAELESKLETKQSFIKELRADLYKAHDSLIDKQKDIDKLKQELFKLKKLNEDNARALQQNIPGSRLSDTFLLSTEANISDLRKHKKELMNSLLGLQKQFYEAKKISTSHFEKSTRHIESLRALQVSPSLSKSESAPFLNYYSMSNAEQSKKWDRTLRNAKIDLEVDIECLLNFKVFLKRFFSPIMSQSNDDETKKDEIVQTDLKDEDSKPAKSKENSKLPSKIFSNSIERRLRGEKEEPSHDRLAATASTISVKLDWIENVLKTVIDEFEQLSDMESVINETARDSDAKSILLKLFDSLVSLQENASEIFHMNSKLKSSELFDNNLHHSNSKQDSDHESLLSDETIALSRSASLSPVSFDGQFATNSVHQKHKGRALIHSYIKQSEEIKRIPLRPSHKVISSSQDSVFQRSHYSSPDLGIESDPNHEHSAPEEVDKFHSTKVSTSKHDLSGSAMYKNLDKQRLSSINSFSDSSFKFKDKSLLVLNGTLHAIGILQDYELLKNEISESIVGIKSILSRTGDGMQHITTNASPRKKLEYSTFKAIKDTCLNLDVCLEKANKLVNNFWVATCPTEDEWRQLIHQNEELNSMLKKMSESKKKQEKDFKDAFDRLKQAETIKEQQEQRISKKLVKTKKILRQAERKILETRNKELPLLAKHSFKAPLNPL